MGGFHCMRGAGLFEELQGNQSNGRGMARVGLAEWNLSAQEEHGVTARAGVVLGIPSGSCITGPVHLPLCALRVRGGDREVAL